jgi:hypothetical protein
MRTFLIGVHVIALSALVPSATAAQDRWLIGLGISRDAFTGGSDDTTTIPGTRLEVAPAPRTAVELGLSRSAGPWELGLQLGHASGHLRAKTDAVILEDRTAGVTRWRVSVLGARRLASLDRVSLFLQAGPAIEYWESGGIGNRTTLSGRAGFALRASLGRISFENLATVGIGGSPFRQRDLPPEAEVRRLLTWSIGAGMRLTL